MASKEVWAERAYRSLRDAGLCQRGDGVAVRRVCPDMINAPTGWVYADITHGATVQAVAGMYRVNPSGQVVIDWVQ